MDALSKPHEQNTEAGKRPQEPAHRVDVRPATRQDLAAGLALLEANQLPTVGVREHFQHFLVAYDGTTLVGSAGLEIYGRAGLLRSVAVAAPYRSQGLGRQLAQSMLALARHTGLTSVALLTNTAQHYFLRYGFVPVARSSLAEALNTSEELKGACCASAVAMSLTL